MSKSKTRGSKNREAKSLLCMNSNPDESKWGMYAPPGGCDEIVHNVDESTTKVLCWKCTSRSTGGVGSISRFN